MLFRSQIDLVDFAGRVGTDEGKALRKIVKIGVQTKDEVQITEGLDGEEMVIVEGQSKMNDGDKVLVVD
mgnify:CR=1 FL=1